MRKIPLLAKRKFEPIFFQVLWQFLYFGIFWCHILVPYILVPHTFSYFHAYYAYGKPDPLVTPFRTYQQFGIDKKIRMLQFRHFVETMTDSEEYEWKQRLNHPYLKTKKDLMKNYLQKSGEG